MEGGRGTFRRGLPAWWWSCVVALSVLASVVAPAAAQSICSSTINGQKYDLSPLRNFYQTVQAGHYSVTYQPCTVISCGTYPQAALCQKFNGVPGTGGFSVGDNPTGQWLPSARGDKGFQLKFNAENGRVSTKVDFICDPNFVGAGTMKAGPQGPEPITNNYHFEWTISYILFSGGDDDGGLAGGWIFIIVLVSVTVVYFVGGYAFNRFYRKAEGIENQIPQYEFWVGLPGLVKDGCLYSYRKVSALIGRGSGSETL